MKTQLYFRNISRSLSQSRNVIGIMEILLYDLQIVNGRICGDIAVSRAFGDMRFKTKKYEYVLASFPRKLIYH